MHKHRGNHRPRKVHNKTARESSKDHPMDDVDRPHNLYDSAIKAAAAGAVAYLGTNPLLGSGSVAAFGMQKLPLRAVLAATSATSSLVNDATRATIFGKHGLHLGILQPQIPLIGGAVANMAIAKTFTEGDNFKYSNPISNRNSIFRIGALGAGAQASAEFAHLWAVRSRIIK